MERNDGSALEQLVSLIESHFSPQGFRVETRKPVFNENKVQVAEFDILITGYIGTGHLTYLIECRDRPSEGPAPASWIEQLIGRRARFRLDKVMAVSSTGFAPGAVAAAADASIELRELQSLTYDYVAHWLPRNAPMIVHKGQFKAVRTYINDNTASTEKRQCVLSLDEPLLVGNESGERLSFRELWQKLVNRRSVWKGIPEGGPPIEVTVKVADHISEGYTAEVEGRALPVLSIEFDATLHAYFPKMPLVEAKEYSTALGPDGKQTYARVGRWEAPEGSLIRSLTFIGFLKGPDDREDIN